MFVVWIIATISRWGGKIASVIVWLILAIDQTKRFSQSIFCGGLDQINSPACMADQMIPTVEIQKTSRGSRWFYGNFFFGVEVASHPRFFEVAIGLGWLEIIAMWKRKK
jgi:hypothetical protein